MGPVKQFRHVECPKCSHVIYDEAQELTEHLARIEKQLVPFMNVVRECGGIPEMCRTFFAPDGNMTKHIRVGSMTDTAAFKRWLSSFDIEGKKVWFSDLLPYVRHWDSGGSPVIRLGIEGISL